MPGLAAALPSHVEVVSIFAHSDETGLKNAREIARLIFARGIETHIRGLV
jgi:hypothetical protein